MTEYKFRCPRCGGEFNELDLTGACPLCSYRFEEGEFWKNISKQPTAWYRCPQCKWEFSKFVKGRDKCPVCNSEVTPSSPQSQKLEYLEQRSMVLSAIEKFEDEIEDQMVGVPEDVIISHLKNTMGMVEGEAKKYLNLLYTTGDLIFNANLRSYRIT